MTLYFTSGNLPPKKDLRQFITRKSEDALDLAWKAGCMIDQDDRESQPQASRKT